MLGVLVSLVSRRCGRTASFRKCVVMLVCVLGFYLLLSATLSKKSYKVYRGQPPVLPTISKPGLSVLLPQSLPLAPGRGSEHSANLSIYGNMGYVSEEDGVVRTVLPRVLLLYDKESSVVAKGIRVLLESHRIPFDAHLLNPNLPPLPLEVSRPKGEQARVGRYCLIVCADMAFLYDSTRRHLHHYISYSIQFNVTLISLVSPESTANTYADFTLTSIDASNIKMVHLNPLRDFYYLKAEEEWVGDVPTNSSWTTLIPADSALIHHWRFWQTSSTATTYHMT